MKRTLKILFTILAVTLVFGMTACSDKPGEEKQASVGSATYSGIGADGNAYILTVTETEGRSARYAAQTGDYYVLKIIVIDSGAVKISKGKVTGAGGTLKLTPEGGSEFTVEVSGEGIKTINGEIKTDKGPVTATNVSVTASSNDSELNATWKNDIETLVFNNGKWNETWIDGTPNAKGTYITGSHNTTKFITAVITDMYEAEGFKLNNGTNVAKGWYTVDQVKSLIVTDYRKNPSTYGGMSISDLLAYIEEEYFSPFTYKYVVNGSTVSFWGTDGSAYGKELTYTKK